jgi:hypothetical protein
MLETSENDYEATQFHVPESVTLHYSKDLGKVFCIIFVIISENGSYVSNTFIAVQYKRPLSALLNASKITTFGYLCQ